ncbi:hypothetical protein D3C78_1527170 [compost metagenome]
MRRLARVELLVQVLQLRRHEGPVVQHLLHAAGNAGRIMGQAQIAGDNNELAVARAVFVGSKFHGDWTLVDRVKKVRPGKAAIELRFGKSVYLNKTSEF